MTRPRACPASLRAAAVAAMLVCALSAVPAPADDTHGPPSAGGDAPAAAGDAGGAEIRIVLDGAAASGGRARTFAVARGRQVRVTLREPGPAEFHLHGYDLTARTTATLPGEIVFRAEHVGRFALIVHDGDDPLGRTERAVAYVEVRP